LFANHQVLANELVVHDADPATKRLTVTARQAIADRLTLDQFSAIA
jgi:hypothetical protein